MAKKKRTTKKFNPKSYDEHQCVYCGKNLENGKAPFRAKAITRDFPVCSETCKEATEAYVEKDKKLKVFLYLVLFFAAIGIFIGAIFGENPKIYCPCVMAAGLAFIFFPYPISSFETFLDNSIKSVTRLTRLIGLIVFAAGLFFLLYLTTH